MDNSGQALSLRKVSRVPATGLLASNFLGFDINQQTLNAGIVYPCTLYRCMKACREFK